MGGFAVTVVVGPAAVCGPGRVDADLVDVALTSIDDEWAVFDERVVTVRSLWCRIAREVSAGDAGPTRLVVPSAWPAARVEFVEEMLLTACARVCVRRRSAVLLGTAEDVPEVNADVVVEIGPDCAMIHRLGSCVVVSRSARADFVADSVLAAIGEAPAVTIDAADGVAGATALAAVLARRLRRSHAHVSVVDDAAVRSAAGRRDPPIPRSSPRRPRVLRAAVLTAPAAVVAVLVAAAGAVEDGRSEESDLTWVVEGRVAVQLPASWTVDRITTGPGSARVQAVSPAKGTAMYVTAARVHDAETVEATAVALREALDRQPQGVFVNFTAERSVAGRPAVTYTENRSPNPIEWTVVLDRGVRIAVGCRRSSARRDVDLDCERAVRSARAVP